METTKERPILFSGPMVRAILDGRKTQTRRLVKGPQPTGPFLGCFERNGRYKAWLQDRPTSREIICPYGQPIWRQSPRFADGSPPCDGWYWVRWDAESAERLVWLARVADEPQDDPRDHDVERWVWSETPNSEPESVCLDVREPLDIQWRRPGDRLWVRETWRVERFPSAPDAPHIHYRADQTAEHEAYSAARMWKPSIFMPRWASRITLEVIGVRVERLQEISEVDAIAEGMQSPGIPAAMSNRAAFARLWDDINGKRAPWASNPWVWVVEFRRLP